MGLLDLLGFDEAIREPVECKIEVDGAEISDLYPQLLQATVTMKRSAPAEGSLVFDSFREMDGDWIVQDSGLLETWKPIVLTAVFGDREMEVIRGYITEINTSYPESMGAAQVTVNIQDDSVLLDREQKRVTRSTEEEPKTDGIIATEIASEYNLTSEAATGISNKSLLQQKTDYRFLSDRAKANGFELLFREGNLYFGPSQLEGEPQSTIKVYAGDQTNCMAFDVVNDGHKPDQIRIARSNEEGQGTSEEVYTSNLKVLGSTQADSTNSGLGDFVWEMEQGQGGTEEEVNARAQASANENAWKIQATGELDGVLYGYVLYSHQTVVVDGIGSTQGGLYYVDEVVHEFTAKGYKQKFKLLRNASGEDEFSAVLDVLAGVV